MARRVCMYVYMSVLVAQSVERSSRSNQCVRKTKVRPSLRPADQLQEIPFSKELTDNY